VKAAIRPARAGDSARIGELLAELGYMASAEQVRERLAATSPLPALHLVAQSSSGTVVAYLSACLLPYFPDGSTLCRITALVVASTERRTGVGAALVDAAAEYARHHGCAALEVTSADRRIDAHRFYEDLGFSRTSVRFIRRL
jgi:GNAT superfamily N-acetyltransferase